MKTLKQFIDESQKYKYKHLGFETRGSNTIFKFYLSNEEKGIGYGEAEPVSFKDWKSSSATYKPNAKMEDRIIKAMLSNITQFNKKVDANSAIKSANTFIAKVEAAQKFSGNVTKAGVKTKLNLF